MSSNYATHPSQLNNIDSLKNLIINDENFDIRNLKFLKKAKNLEELFIYKNTLKLSDLSPLLGVKSLRYVSCMLNEVDEISELFDQIEGLDIDDHSPDTRDNVKDQVERILARFPRLKQLSYKNMDLEGIESYVGREEMLDLTRELESKYPGVTFKILRPA